MNATSREMMCMENKKSLFLLPDRPDIIRASVKDYLCIVDKPQPCAKTGRMYTLSEADGIEDMTTACIRQVRDKAFRNCIFSTVACLLCILRQVYCIYSSSQNLCITFSSKFHSLYRSFSMWLSLTSMCYIPVLRS